MFSLIYKHKRVFKQTWKTLSAYNGLVLIVLCFSLNNILIAQITNNNVRDQISSLLEDEFFNRSILSIDAYDLTTDKSIIQLNNKLLLHPASNEKILTSATALILGKQDSEFSTNFYYTGIIADSILYGNIFVVGSGDPDFSTTELDSLILQMKNSGIKIITGNLYGDVSLYDSLYWGNGWMWDDDPSSDVPYLTPLIINNSVIKVAIKPSQIGKPIIASTIPKTDFIKIINNSITVEDDSSDVEVSRGWISRNNTIKISGQLSSTTEVDTQEVNIYRPDIYFLNLVKQSFNNNGIEFSGIVDTLSLPDSVTQLISFSRPIIDVLHKLNKESNNLSAESLLRMLAFQYYGKPATAENGIKVIDSLITIIGLEPDDYRIVDGSGLSHYNLITTELVTALLKFLYNQYPDYFNLIYSSFPIAGVDGTLKDRMMTGNVYDNVHAKTGSLSGISTLSGYLTTRNNDLIAFSIFIQNFVGKPDNAKKIQDKICEILVEMNSE